MAYEYGQSWPITPITPLHSPHASGGSSIRTRTPGQLSLHEYRKMQVTPSPPAIAGQRTVKKKRGLSSLSHKEGILARSQDVNFNSSSQSLTTPPETPSLGLLMDFTPNVWPVDTTNRPHVAHASVDTTYPEFEHLLSPGSDLFQNSPPYSPPVSSRPSSASHKSFSHRFVGTRDKLSRPWTSHWQQDQRYVELRKLHSEVPRPRSEQAARRVDSVGVAADNIPGLQGIKKTRLQSGSWFPVIVPDSSTRSTAPGVGSNQHSKLSDQTPIGHIPNQPQVQSQNLSRAVGALEDFGLSGESIYPRERRLPRPNAPQKRRPAPLRLTTNNTEGLYLSGTNTASTSTFSLSKYPFPQPPKEPAGLADVQPILSSVQDFAAPDLRLVTAKSPAVRFSGVSFEIVNPRLSLEDAILLSSSEEGGLTNSDLSGNLIQVTEEDMSSNKGEAPRRPRRHSTLQGAHEAITGSSSQSSPSIPENLAVPTTPHRSFTAPSHASTTPSLWTFDDESRRISPQAELPTDAIQVGPSAGQYQLDFSASMAPLQASSTVVRLQSPSYVQAPTGGDNTSFNGHFARPSEANLSGSKRTGDSIDTTRSASLLPLPRVHPSAGSSSFDVDSFYGGRDSSYLDRASGVSDALSALQSGDRYSSYASIFTGGSGNPFLDPLQGRESADVRSSDFSSSVDRRRDSNIDPFAYDDYLRSPHRGNSTISHLIGQYGHHKYTANSGDEPRPLETFAEEDEPDAFHRSTAKARPRNASFSHICVHDKEVSGTSSAACLPSATNRSDRAHLGALIRSDGSKAPLNNDNRHGDSIGPSPRIPLWQRYGLLGSGSSRRRIPIEKITSWEDFEDLVRDMAFQPILQEVDETYRQRYRALMHRIEMLHGLNFRKQAQDQIQQTYYESMSELNIATEVHAGRSGYGASDGARNTAALAHRPNHMDTGASVVRDQGVRRASSMQFRSQCIDGDDDLIEQHEAESNSSPLDPSPHPSKSLSQRHWESHLPQIGSPPHGRLPTLPTNTVTGLPPPSSLFTSRTPIESSNVSSYGNTDQLLNLQSPKSSQLPISRREDGNTNNRPEQHHGEPSGRSRGVPEMWMSNSPPGTSSYRHRSQNSDADLAPGHSTSRLADAMNDAEEWLTEPNSSRHNSAIPDQYTRVGDHAGLSVWTDCRVGAFAPHSTVFNDPAYQFGSQTLERAPCDDAEPTFETSRVMNRSIQPYEDIELGMRLPSSSRALRSPRIALPLPTRIRHRSNDTDVTAFPSSRDLKSASTRYPVSIRSGNSRHRPASVHGQTSQIRLLMTPSRVAVTTPMTIQRPVFVPKVMSRGQKLLADIIRYSCVTWLAPLGLFPFLLGVGVLEFWVKGRASKQMKRFALAEAFIVFIVVAVAATVGITLSIRDERRANGSDY